MPTNSVKFSSFFKYFSNDRQVLEGIFNNRKIRFTQPWALNDPLELNPVIQFTNSQVSHQRYILNGILLPSLEEFIRVQFIESQINAYGILSLTKLHDSFDMWSHYANGHKGFVMEFKPGFNKHQCMKSKEGKTYQVRKVIYSKEYALKIENLRLRQDATGMIPIQTLQNEFFFKKTSRWKQEKEYRLARLLSDSPDYHGPLNNCSHRDQNLYLFDFSLDCISSIIFGAYMSTNDKKLIVEACKNFSIRFYQATIIKDQIDRYGKPGNVTIIPINELVSYDELYSFPPQGFCLGEDQINHLEPIPISGLAELPYYKNYEVVIQEYLESSQNSK